MNISKYKWIPIALYTVLILYITIFSRTPGSERIVKGLFWEVQVGYWRDIALNILLFIPLGILIGDKRAILIGLALSVGIELTQYVFKLGICEVDDLVNNTIGTAIGFSLYSLFSVLFKKYKNKRTQKT